MVVKVFSSINPAVSVEVNTRREEQMQAKPKILISELTNKEKTMKLMRMTLVLLVFALVATTTSFGQGGWNIERDQTLPKLIMGGNNQQAGKLIFRGATVADEPAIEKAETGENTITVTYGDLKITNSADSGIYMWCAGTTDNTMFNDLCEASNAEAGDGEVSAAVDDKNSKVTLTVDRDFEGSFVLAFVRLDVSGMADKAKVPVSVVPGAGATVGLGGTPSGGLSGYVGEIAAGTAVTATAATGLACAADQPLPTITVDEGFSGAWTTTARSAAADIAVDFDGTTSPGAPATNDVKIKIAITNFPEGGKVEWPETVNATADLDTDNNGDTDAVTTNVGTLTYQKDESPASGQTAVYLYARLSPDYISTANTDEDGTVRADTPISHTAVRSFGITPTKHTFSGAQTLGVTAMLYPMANIDSRGEKSDLASVLSFDADPVVPIKDKEPVTDWLVLGDCVTYLLYPFITCGATSGWSTGVSVSNTSADGNVFGAFDESKEQSGSVVMYGFPRGQAAPAEDAMVEPVVSTVSSELMAGDTHTFNCADTTMAGMEGYAIIKANFQHARGMAFVLGNFADGAGVDVSHGYMAEVIIDPATRSETISE